MRSSPRLPLLCLFTLAAGLGAGQALAAPADTPEAAARQYLAAEKTFDLAALKNAITADFVEISPRGEIDERDRVLSFYAPDKKVPTPPAELGEFKTRQTGDTAVVSTTLSVALPGRSVTLTVGMTAIHTAGGWKLLSAQYTPARPAAAK